MYVDLYINICKIKLLYMYNYIILLKHYIISETYTKNFSLKTDKIYFF